LLSKTAKRKDCTRTVDTKTAFEADIKKAYVTLKKGDSIPIFASVEEAEASRGQRLEKEA
jgi:ribosomal protein L23